MTPTPPKLIEAMADSLSLFNLTGFRAKGAVNAVLRAASEAGFVLVERGLVEAAATWIDNEPNDLPADAAADLAARLRAGLGEG